MDREQDTLTKQQRYRGRQTEAFAQDPVLRETDLAKRRERDRKRKAAKLASRPQPANCESGPVTSANGEPELCHWLI
jgi:hypothetical protein